MNTNETTNAACLLGALGGKARAARMTPEQRSEAARKAGKARQAKARASKQQTGLGQLPAEYLQEYDSAAEWFAGHGELPRNMAIPGALEWVDADPEAFQQRVNEFKYAKAAKQQTGGQK